MRSFGKDNLDRFLRQQRGVEVKMDPTVEEFLIDAANEFIEEVLGYTGKLVRQRPKKQEVDGEGSYKRDLKSFDYDPSVKFSMKTLYEVDIHQLSETEIRKIKKINRGEKKRISLKLAENSYLA